MRVYSVVTLLGFTFLTMQACERVALEPDNVTRGELVRGNYKTDASKSCVGQCGAKAPGGCWCDAECERFGDCCPDKLERCGNSPLDGGIADSNMIDAGPIECSSLTEAECTQRPDCEYIWPFGEAGFCQA